MQRMLPQLKETHNLVFRLLRPKFEPLRKAGRKGMKTASKPSQGKQSNKVQTQRKICNIGIIRNKSRHRSIIKLT